MTNNYSFTDRLKFEHVKAIHELDQKKAKWEKLKKEYEDLKDKLLDLPLKLKHDFKVPIGSVGMFEGQLVHTNEIMVLLGDNWFAQCSAHKAVEIINHRLQVLEKNLKEVADEIKFLDSRKQATEQLSAMDKGDGIIDIEEESKEEYPKPTGKRWIAHEAAHSVTPRSLKELDRKKKGEQAIGDSVTESEGRQSVEKLFARLDELELEEERAALKEHELKMKELKSDTTNHVRFEETEHDEEPVVKNDQTVDNEGENCIKFKHTKNVMSPNEDFTGEKSSDDGREQKLVSPADIYTHFIKPQTADVIEDKPLRSILKKERKHSSEGVKPKPILKQSPEHKSDASSGDESTAVAASEEPKPILKTGAEAISETVIEHDVRSAALKADTELPKKKTVSRFKASRLNK